MFQKIKIKIKFEFNVFSIYFGFLAHHQEFIQKTFVWAKNPKYIENPLNSKLYFNFYFVKHHKLQPFKSFFLNKNWRNVAQINENSLIFQFLVQIPAKVLH